MKWNKHTIDPSGWVPLGYLFADNLSRCEVMLITVLKDSTDFLQQTQWSHSLVIVVYGDIVENQDPGLTLVTPDLDHLFHLVWFLPAACNKYTGEQRKGGVRSGG